MLGHRERRVIGREETGNAQGQSGQLLHCDLVEAPAVSFRRRVSKGNDRQGGFPRPKKTTGVFLSGNDILNQ